MQADRPDGLAQRQSAAPVIPQKPDSSRPESEPVNSAAGEEPRSEFESRGRHPSTAQEPFLHALARSNGVDAAMASIDKWQATIGKPLSAKRRAEIKAELRRDRRANAG